MQLITLLSTAFAMAATASAGRLNAAQLNEAVDLSLPYARIINRCKYDVYLWSVLKSTGCPTEGMFKLKSGGVYTENYATKEETEDGKTGISIKISKTQECKGNDITQLEYFREMNKPGYEFNYLDVSYVDCQGMNCPTRQEGYYLVAGNQIGAYASGSDNKWCPKMSCWDAVSCDKISYVLPDDPQTKSCDNGQSMDFYMCGGEAPDGDSGPKPSSSAKPSSSPAQYSATKPKSTPKPTPVHASSSSSTADLKVAAAAITSSSTTPSDIPKYTKTQVVYVTAYKYVDAKRHAHDHARRHQPFHA